MKPDLSTMTIALSGPDRQGFMHVAPSAADQLQILRRRWRLIFGTLCVVIIATAAALAQMPKIYTATGVLLYEPGNGAGPGDPANKLTEDALNADAATASQAAVITSLQTVRTIATQLRLDTKPEFNPALRQPPWQKYLPRAALAARPDAAVTAAAHALAVSVQPQSRVIDISFASADPDLAAAAVNLAMQIYLDHERAEAISALNDAQNWILTNATVQQRRLAATETALAQARQAAGLEAGEQASLTAETASRLAASLVQAQADLAMNQARLSAVAQGAAPSDAATANAAVAPNLQPLRKEQADLTAQIQSMSGAYGPDYPALAAAQSALAAINAQIDDETGREMNAAKAEVAADQAEISTLQDAMKAARAQSESEDAESGPVHALEEQEDAGRDMLRNMTLQADQLAQEAALTRPDARIISAAVPPDAPDAPHRALFLAAASGLGLCLGVLLAGLAEALDTTLRSGGAVRSSTGLSCLAQVPEVRNPGEAAIAAPFSLFAEQMRALRTGLMLAGADRQVIAITAARPGEGKTTTTVALGRALAAAGVSVLAIDGDIRQPSFDALFGLGGAPGLTDHLAGLAALDMVIRQDAMSALHVVPAGGRADAALSLFLSPAMPALLHVLRLRYEVVLLDVPPAFALAEGRVLARAADAALLCVRWGNTPRRVVTAAIDLLREANVNLIGAALTRVNKAAHGRSGFPDAEIYQPRYGGYFRKRA